MAKKPTSSSAKSQGAQFVEAARSLGCDEDPAHFDEALKKVARHKPSKDNDGPIASQSVKQRPRRKPRDD